MTSLQLNLALAPLPTGTAEDGNAYGQSLISNLSATINGNILTGQTLGVQPVTDIGPWFDGTTWWFFNTIFGAYLPMPDVQANFNAVSNAQMMVNQRRKTWTNVADNTYTLDRYRYRTSLLTGKVTILQNNIRLPGTAYYPRIPYSLRVACSTLQNAIGNAEIAFISQPVMRLQARNMWDGLTSLSIILASSVTGTYYVALRNADKTWVYLMACVITQANVPTRFEFDSIPIMPTGAGSWGVLESDMSYDILIILAAGAAFNGGTAGVWQNANTPCASDQINFFSSTSNILDITVLQHQPGPTSTPFLFVPFDKDIFDCQQYYCKSDDYFNPVNTPNVINACSFFVSASNFCEGVIRFPRSMRVTPTIATIYSTAGGVNTLFDGIGATNRAVSSISGLGTNGFHGIIISGSSFSSASSGMANSARFHYDMDAEIYT